MSLLTYLVVVLFVLVEATLFKNPNVLSFQTGSG